MGISANKGQTTERRRMHVFFFIRLQDHVYCSPAWSGMCSAANRARLDSFLNRCKRLGFCDKDLPSATELFSDADDALF